MKQFIDILIYTIFAVILALSIVVTAFGDGSKGIFEL
uniref:Uncharacterized protein n=1 Tax=Dulem virus 42 TaxID=3145760 RepID=A0AAU8BAA5_9CAUD